MGLASSFPLCYDYLKALRKGACACHEEDFFLLIAVILSVTAVAEAGGAQMAEIPVTELAA